MKPFAICSNPDCAYSIQFASGPIAYDENTKFGDDFGPTLPEFKFCELCGDALLFYCPHCKQGLFAIPTVKHCRLCGKKIKPSKYDGIGTTVHV